MTRRSSDRPTRARQATETLIVFGAALALALLFRATVACAYEIPSGSMEPTVMTFDRIVAEKVSVRFEDPEVGDIVLIENPVGGTIPFLKRVIALQGQTIDLKDGQVWIDGHLLDEPYAHGLPTYPDVLEMPFTVPEGQIWVMGDNRTGSQDSRYFGPVPIDSVLGRAVAVYWPPQHMRGLLEAE